MVHAPLDLGLAERCVSGNRAAQRELFERSRGRVHATLYRILGNNRDIEDLVQESFIQIFRSLKVFRGEASLATWIDRITVRVAYAHFAHKGPRTSPLEAVPEPAAGDPSAERRALAREAARRLYTVLDRLEAKQRVAFSLHVIGGQPLKEVALAMEASLVATKVRVWRARREVERHAKGDPVLAEFLGNETGEAP